MGCAEWTLHQLFTATLKTLSVMTRNAADHLALKPTATIMHAMKPNNDRNARPMLHSPWRIKPRKRNMRRTRPARRKLRTGKISVAGKRSSVLFSTVILTDAWDTSEQLLARHHRVTEYHEKTSNDRKVAEEKCHVKDETVAKALNNNDREKTCDAVFCMALRYNRTGADNHRLPNTNGIMARVKEGEMTYKDIDHEKKMRDSLRETPMPKWRKSLFGRASRDKKGGRVLLQIPELVTPLCDDPE